MNPTYTTDINIGVKNPQTGQNPIINEMYERTIEAVPAYMVFVFVHWSMNLTVGGRAEHMQTKYCVWNK